MRITHKEEEFVLDDRPAKRPALIVLNEYGPLDPAGVVEPINGVERRVLMLPEDLAVPGVRSRLGNKLDLDGALAGAVGPEVRGRDSDLLHGLKPGRDEGEETGAAAFEPLGVVRDAVQRDVD